MDTLFLLLQIVVALWVIWGLFEILALWIGRRYQQPDTSPQIYFVNTQDNWRIAVHRYSIVRTLAPSSDVPSAVGEGSLISRTLAPSSGVPSAAGEGSLSDAAHPLVSPTSKNPILLCHGLASNRFQVDLEGKSLARYLQSQGFDVWVIEFRGAGFSSDSKKNKFVSFDEYASQDLPAAIEKILSETKQEQLHLVGYSTGALAAMAFAAKHPQKIASIVSIGAPIQFIDQGYLHRFLVIGSFLSTFGDVKLSTLMKLYSPLGSRVRPRWMRAMMNSDNISTQDLKTGLANAVEDFSRDLLRQLEDWVTENQLRSLDHSIDYRKEFSKITAPLLLIAGSQDILAPESSIEPTLSIVSSKQKELKLAGKKAGLSNEYGHIDLAYGERVEKEIFVWIKDWLSASK
jgi:pimeloyl-ACP methyl ester carboxylesterase